ncbi:hypothetical protein SAMN05428949_1156 [Chitinophaga sp. YR627]|uniref:imm11 family protein n=1 Tax=Chitinophaga sp. YR627 TaxID=1881041 RepID=UPI0008EF89FD|nr:DUF1629 domain-containing protein [Chitinophaga sp. YR627]SFM88127.1 hypothetical protein SAMN05428949_1156 [Chitinophaga sp. YR627]
MNHFLRITTAEDYPLKFAANNPEVDNDIDLGKFVHAARLNGPLHYTDAENIDIPVEVFAAFDAIESVSGGILISRRLKELIDLHFPQQVQLFESDFVYKGQLITGFYAMNVYNKVECYDLERSVFEVSTVDGSYDFEKIALIDGPLQEFDVEYDIVRSLHDNKIVVSAAFKNLMETSDVKAFGFEDQFVIEF